MRISDWSSDVCSSDLLPTLGESFHQPTVLVGVGPDALVNREETFGPLAAIIRFDTEAEAIRIANDTASGLAAYLYTSDSDRQVRVSQALEYGMEIGRAACRERVCQDG